MNYGYNLVCSFTAFNCVVMQLYAARWPSPKFDKQSGTNLLIKEVCTSASTSDELKIYVCLNLGN